jgi:hypothetical protein
MIAVVEPLTAGETEVLEDFRYAEDLGYARSMRHVLNRWTWEETQRYLREREERRNNRMEVTPFDGVKDVLERVRLGLLSVESAQRYIDKVWREPEPIGISLERAFPESRERKED